MSPLFETWAWNLHQAAPLADKRLYIMTDHTMRVKETRKLLSKWVKTMRVHAPQGKDKQAARWNPIIRLIRRIATRQHVIVSDVDVIWRRNPFNLVQQLIKSNPSMDFAVSTDKIAPIGATNTLEPTSRCFTSFNIGIMLFPHGRRRGVEALELAVAALHLHPGKVDQGTMNKAWKLGLFKKNKLCALINGSSFAGILPLDRFCNALTVQLGTCKQPVAVHMTYLRSQNLESKILRIREFGWWRGALSLKAIRIPPQNAVLSKSLMIDGMPRNHIKLMSTQLKYIMGALSLARKLNRSLILPEMWCTCEIGWWQGHVQKDCRARNWAALPFRCPVEHFLDPTALKKYGFDIAFPHEPIADVLSIDKVPVVASDVPNSIFSSWCCSTNPEYKRYGGNVPFRLFTNSN